MGRLPEQDGGIPEGEMSVIPFFAGKIIDNSVFSFDRERRE